MPPTRRRPSAGWRRRPSSAGSTDVPATGEWNDDELRLLVEAQHEVLGADPAALTSPSTAHVSVVDDDGDACAVTVSSGYGSGVLSPGTGIWLNNCLGEQELLPAGLAGLRPGDG